jgi:hypothetical protein
MKAYGGVDVQIHIFLTSALAGGEWSASRPGRFTSGTRALGAQWLRVWVGPRTGLDDVEWRKMLPYRDSNFDPSAFQPVATRGTECAVPIKPRDFTFYFDITLEGLKKAKENIYQDSRRPCRDSNGEHVSCKS